MSDTEKTEITKVMMVIREFLSETRDVVSSAEKSQQWIIQFRNTLCYQDLEGNPNKFALKLLAEARGFSDLKRRNQQMRWVRESLAKDGISNPSKKQLEERWMLIYGSGENPQNAPNGNAGVDRKLATSCDKFKADGDTREGSKENANGSAITRNETRTDSLDSSANNYGPRQAKNGDAATREGAEDCHHHSNVAIARPTTVSKTLALDMPSPDKVNAKTRDSRGSGRYQPPSLGPEDGTIHDQETAIEISTDEKRTGGHSPLSRSPSSRPQVRDRRVTGDVLSLAYSGEFQNVRLTQEQYNELGIRFGNLAKLNRAIDSLSCKIENGETNPKNHYAELVKWANYRDDMDEAEEVKAAKQPHYETVSEHNARIVRESDKWIDEYYSQKRKAANGK